MFDLPDPNSILIIGIEINPRAVPHLDTSDHFEDTHEQHFPNNTNSNTEIMSTDITPNDFLKMASSHINKTFSGDPLCLNSFIDSIDLLHSLATTAALRTLLVSFLKTKIDGKAREFLTETDNTVDLIKTALRTNIKPDNSKVVEARMLSLRLTITNQQEFTTKAEELAESLRRSLVVEGMSHAKANEITIDKTIELCRANARSDLVKSVLEASTFTQPKEVIAKLLVQSDKAKKEHQILSFKTNPRQASHQKQSPKPNQNRFNRNNYRGNNPNSTNGFTPNWNNTRQNNRNPPNGQRRQFTNYTGQSNFNNRNRNGNQTNDRFIRVTNSGNEERPAQMRLGAQNNETDQ